MLSNPLICRAYKLYFYKLTLYIVRLYNIKIK